ncbi:hypothetical protein [Nostoc sp. CHAB 5715]|uniref:hypothetical protein n=1 Tax=Nostoc sp. CHAB 5715 TaxID=2780400 RepID=UPI001E61B077|nr:hypothetical protein [Nostoc sp. CHAB 5715]MCC5621758.1 hypothetical protein [Nostoc sp. CHAB 5715]
MFTTLTVTEEANLSGGKKYKSKPPEHKPEPKPEPKPTYPAPKFIVNLSAIITQTAVNVNSGDVEGNLVQTAVNQIGV